MSARNHRRIAGTFLTLLVASGCYERQRTDGPSESLIVTDSSGVEIITIGEQMLQSLPVRWAAATPSASIGRMDGPDEQLLGSVRDAIWLPNGNLALADVQQAKILVFNATGRYSHAIGRRGPGPGEFRTIFALNVIGDTLLVADIGTRRIHQFREDGSHIGERNVKGGAGQQIGLAFFRPTPTAIPFIYLIAPDGYPWIASDGPREVVEGDGPHRVFQVLSQMDSVGTRRDTIVRAETWYVAGNLAAHPAAAEVHAVYVAGKAVVADARIDEVRYYTHDVRLERVLRLPRMASSEDRRSILETDWTIKVAGRDRAQLAARAREALPAPKELPSFYALRPGSNGSVWLATAPVERDGASTLWTRWLRVSNAGIPVEWIITPSVEVLDLTPKAVVALERDDFEVQRVTIYPIADSAYHDPPA